MQLRPKQSFNWTEKCCCCGSKTSSLLIFLLYILLHISLLSISSMMLHRPDELVPLLISVIDTRDRVLADSDFYQEFEEAILTNPAPYFSIPIIFNLILLISNFLACFGTIFHMLRL